MLIVRKKKIISLFLCLELYRIVQSAALKRPKAERLQLFCHLNEFQLFCHLNEFQLFCHLNELNDKLRNRSHFLAVTKQHTTLSHLARQLITVNSAMVN